MSELNIISQVQKIVVEPVSGTITVINAGRDSIDQQDLNDAVSAITASSIVHLHTETDSFADQLVKTTLDNFGKEYTIPLPAGWGSADVHVDFIIAGRILAFQGAALSMYTSIWVTFSGAGTLEDEWSYAQAYYDLSAIANDKYNDWAGAVTIRGVDDDFQFQPRMKCDFDDQANAYKTRIRAVLYRVT